VDGEHSTDVFGRAAVEVIEKHNSTMPFSMYLAF
jgi:hypothetical protein